MLGQGKHGRDTKAVGQSVSRKDRICVISVFSTFQSVLFCVLLCTYNTYYTVFVGLS